MAVYSQIQERSYNRVFNLDVQGHAIKIKYLVITVRFCDHEKIPLCYSFEKFQREGKIWVNNDL